MHEVRKSPSGNYLVTHAVGVSYLNNWINNSYPSWKRYAEKHDLGIVVIDEPLPFDGKKKNVYWDKFLIPSYLSEKSYIRNICYLDTDVVINPSSDDIFSVSDLQKINLVSMIRNMPYHNQRFVRQSLAYHRHYFLDSSYPLQSALFMPISEIYRHHNLPVMPDFACTGVFLLNIAKYSESLKAWYSEVPHDIQTIDNGEQVYLNYFFQDRAKVHWLEYKWQVLWLFEMAHNYAFIYSDISDRELIRKCILNSLRNANFLHFAGSWESFCWHESDRLLSDEVNIEYLVNFSHYCNQTIDWTLHGQIRPEKK